MTDIKVRSGHRSQVTRLINKANQEISAPDLEMEQLGTISDELYRQKTCLIELDERILLKTDDSGLEN